MLGRKKKKKPERTGAAKVIETVGVVVVAIGLAIVIQAFLIKPYVIPSKSMVPTLVEGQRVLVNRLGNNFGDPKVGDVIVFHPPKGADSDGGDCANTSRPADQACDRGTPGRSKETFIKRLVGLPGDTIAIRDGQVIRNGKPADEPFAEPCGGGPACNLPRPIKVPADHYYMMGDNRGDSQDSRYWGPVPRKWIIGGAFATYWPPNRIGLL